MYEAAKIKSGQRKIVFTKTLEKSLWKNTELTKGNLRDEVMRLKQQEGKDMIVYGGSSFVASLVKERLIDEFHLFINPVAIGKGAGIFDTLEGWQALKLIKTITFDSGIVLLHYERNDRG